MTVCPRGEDVPRGGFLRRSSEYCALPVSQVTPLLLYDWCPALSGQFGGGLLPLTNMFIEVPADMDVGRGINAPALESRQNGRSWRLS